MASHVATAATVQQHGISNMSQADIKRLVKLRQEAEIYNQKTNMKFQAFGVRLAALERGGQPPNQHDATPIRSNYDDFESME